MESSPQTDKRVSMGVLHDVWLAVTK